MEYAWLFLYLQYPNNLCTLTIFVSCQISKVCVL